MTIGLDQARDVARWANRHNSRVGSIRSTTASPVVLTFDDGPDPEQTPRVLDVLHRHGATATFFVLLTRVDAFPGLVDDVLAAGHEVALHGPDHRALTDFSYREAHARTHQAKQRLEDRIGREVRWFRPPYGSQSLATLVATERAGLTSVLWSGTTWDWKDVAPDRRLAKAAEGGRPGAILLAHDGLAGPSDGAEDGPPVQCDRPALMEQVLDEYASRGLVGRSLGDALATGRPVRTMRFSRRAKGPGGPAGPMG